MINNNTCFIEQRHLVRSARKVLDETVPERRDQAGVGMAALMETFKSWPQYSLNRVVIVKEISIFVCYTPKLSN